MKLNHPSIIKFIEFDQSGDFFNIIMEYADKGDLSDRIRNLVESNAKMPEDEVLFYFIQLLFGINYIHSNKVIHGDIKPANIFVLDDNIIKIGDFGASKILQTLNEKCGSFVGTMQYISPEIIRNIQYDFKSDIWALGCVLYEMCTLKPAFPYTGSLSIHKKLLLSGKYKPISNEYSKELRELVSSMLSLKPSNRPTTSEIFRSPFIQRRINCKIINSNIYKNPQKLKIVLFGDSGVGKTSIISRFLYDKFDENHIPTTSTFSGIKNITVNEKTFNISILDITNDVNVRVVQCIATSLFIIVYSVDDKNSFKNITKHFNEIRKITLYPLIVLCANKNDLENKVVTDEEGETKANEMKAKYYTISAKTGNNVKQMFDDIAENIANMHLNA